MIINPNVVTLSNEKLAEIKAAEPATIGHFRNFNFSTDHYFASIPGKCAVGRAVTVKVASNDSTLLHKVTEMVGPGDILMIDRAGDRQYAALGGVVSYALKVRNVEAVIIDGAATDIHEIRDMGLLVFYRRLSAITTRIFGLDGEINTRINCFGAAVNPGDIVVADENGFVVLPPDEAESICKKAIEIQETEPGKQKRLDAGEPMANISRAGALIKEYFDKKQ